MTATSRKVDAYVNRLDKWQDAFKALRAIVLATGLDEDLKWGHPCYSADGHNVCLMHGFKDYCALLIMKGALLDDPAGILVQQTKDVQSARQIRFTSEHQVAQMANVLTDYVGRAIEAEKAGLKVPMKKTAEFEMADEFRARLDADGALKTAFKALTPGRQRGWLLYFGSAKQAKTREARIDTATPLIFAGKGRED